MPSDVEPDHAGEKTRRIWARIAGATYLLLVALFMGADQVAQSITGSGGFAVISARVMAQLPLYRAMLALTVVSAALTIVLAIALYTIVKPKHAGLAQLALSFRLAEGFLEAFTCAAAFAVAKLYAGPLAGFDANQMQGLVAVVCALQDNMFNIVTILFGIGSTLFFILFVTSRAIPRLLSVFGVLASLVVPVMGFAGLVVPESSAAFQVGWYPILVAEVTTGLWLLVFAVPERTDHA